MRHATDPDHLAAVTTLIAGTEERAAKAAARLGAAWGSGHATSLFLFGVPIVCFKAYLPDRVEQGAETTVGILIVGLAFWLLVRWRRGLFHVHVHAGSKHPHAAAPARSPLQAYGIGLVHGMAGSAGVGVLLLGSIDDRAPALRARDLRLLQRTLHRDHVDRLRPRPRLGAARASFDRPGPGSRS